MSGESQHKISEIDSTINDTETVDDSQQDQHMDSQTEQSGEFFEEPIPVASTPYGARVVLRGCGLGDESYL